MLYGIVAGLALGGFFVLLFYFVQQFARKLGARAILPVFLVGYFVKLVLLVLAVYLLYLFPAINLAATILAFILSYFGFLFGLWAYLLLSGGNARSEDLR